MLVVSNWQENASGLTPSPTQGSRSGRPFQSQKLAHRTVISPLHITLLLIPTLMSPGISQQNHGACFVNRVIPDP